MLNTKQVNLKHYVEQHEFDVHTQDDGIVLYIPVNGLNRHTGQTGHLGYEAHYCETARETRSALGYCCPHC